GADLKDPKQRIAEAAVTEVDLATCTASLRAVDRRKLGLGRLAAARAVETSHRYEEQPLRVYFEEGARPAAALAGVEMVTTRGASPASYDVKVQQDGANLVARRSDDTVILRVPADNQAPARLREALLGAWRWQFLSRLSEKSSGVSVEARIVPVEVEKNPQGKVVRITGERKDIGRDGGGNL